MKFAVGLTLAALATVVSLQAAPGNMDVTKRAPRVSTEEKAVLPEPQPLERNEVLTDKTFNADQIEKKSAIVGERRSAITVEETRDKSFFAAPEQSKYDTKDILPRKDSPWAGKSSRYSTSEDKYASKVAARFQDKIGDASPVVRDVKPVVSQTTTFSKINRFAFRKNADQTIGAAAAGSETPVIDASERSSLGSGLPATQPR